MEEKQVTLTITTDEGFTAGFLRDLADAIEESETPLRTYETYHGCAEISWPN